MASLILVNPDGSKSKSLNISMSPHLLTKIPKGTILSFRDSDYIGKTGLEKAFTMGSAMVRIHEYYHKDGSDIGSYTVNIESPNTHDYIAALREVSNILGNPFEDLTPPCMIHPSEQSFLRGIRNDFHNSIACVLSWLTGLRKRFGLHFMK